MAALITFPANDIRLEGVDILVVLGPSWLDAVLAEAGVRCRRGHPGGRLAGRLSRSGHDIVVRGRVTAEVELPCVRCLEPAKVTVDAELSLLLESATRAEGRRSKDRRRPAEPTEHELSAEECGHDVYDGDTVVLDDFVREAILLEVPPFPLCSEACPGIRPAAVEPASFERVASVDARWAPLNAFRNAEGAGAATVDDLVAAAAKRSQALGKKPMLRATTRPAVHRKRK